MYRTGAYYAPPPPCRIAGCERPRHAHKLCRIHYGQWRRLPQVWALVTWRPVPALTMDEPRYFRTRETALRAAPAGEPSSVVNVTTKAARPVPDSRAVDALILRSRCEAEEPTPAPHPWRVRGWLT
jgi:hypothetical protein